MIAKAGRSREAAAACLVTFASLLLYIWCLAPSVATTGDSGELIAASFRLGIAHPSGYALYCLLGKGFSWLVPVGEIAWRYNLLSACCGAATAGIVVLLVGQQHSISYSTAGDKLRRESTLPAMGAGLLLAGLVFFGSQSLLAEVYAPTGLAIALLLLCISRWQMTRKPLWLCALALGLGLSLNLHLSVVFLLPGLLVFFWLDRKQHPHLSPARVPSTRSKRQSLLTAGAVAACFLIGFSVTLYLPLRAATFPEPPRETIGGLEYSWWQPLDWGHPADFARWKDHVTVQQYKSLLWQPWTINIGSSEIHLRRFAQTPVEAWRRFVQLLQLLSLQWLWCTPLVLFGAVAAWRDRLRRPLAAAFTITVALNVLIAVHYSVDNVFDIANFLFPTYIVLAIWLGTGISAALCWTRKCGAWSWRLSTLTKLAVVAAIVLQWIFFVGTASWRGNTRAVDDANLRATAIEQLQREAARPATLLCFSDDTLFPFWYVQHVRGRATETTTPYGPARRAFEAEQQLPALAARHLKAGPVAITQWREELDAKFPYAPLTANGNLWQLTMRVLQPPAKVLAGNPSPAPASFLRNKVRRGELIGFQIDFQQRSFPQQKLPLFDATQNAVQNGWAEVLVAQKTLNLVPSPRQATLRLTSPNTSLLAFRQARRLVVPAKAPVGQSLRAILPLEIPLEMPPGRCDVWTRIVATPGDTSTPWLPAGTIELIVR